jgi:hypothetical protein
LCPYQRDESVNSSRDQCNFPGFCHFQRDESVNSSRASRTQPIFVELCPYQRDESQDSLRASRTQPIFVEFCPIQRDESVNSSRDECRFSGFSHFQRDESVNSSRDECRFSGFSHFRRDECRFSDFCQASIHPSSFCLHPLFPPSAFRLSTEFAIRAWAGVICSEEGAIAVRANVVFAAILAGATPRFQASGAFGGVLETFAERVGDTGRPLPSARRHSLHLARTILEARRAAL